MAMIERYPHNLYRAPADFVFTVTREFVRSCPTPTLVLPDDIPPHPYAVAMEIVSLAPNAEASIYPWKESRDTIEKGRRARPDVPEAARARGGAPTRRAVLGHGQVAAVGRRHARR